MYPGGRDGPDKRVSRAVAKWGDNPPPPPPPLPPANIRLIGSKVVQILDNTVTSTSTDDRQDEMVTAFNKDEDEEQEQILTTTVIDTSKDSVSVIRQSDTLERKTNTADRARKVSRHSSNFDEKSRDRHAKQNRYSEGASYDKNSLDTKINRKSSAKHFGGSLERNNVVHIPRIPTTGSLEKQGTKFKDKPSSSKSSLANQDARNSSSSFSFNTLEKPDSKRSSQLTNTSEKSREDPVVAKDEVDKSLPQKGGDKLSKRYSEGMYDRPRQSRDIRLNRNSSALEKTYLHENSRQSILEEAPSASLNLKPGQINLTERDLEPYSSLEKDKRRMARNSGKYENSTLERLNFYDNLNNLNAGGSGGRDTDKKSLVDEYDYDVISGGAAFDLNGIINENFAHPAIRYNGSGLGTSVNGTNLMQQYGGGTLPHANLLHSPKRSKIDRSNSMIEQRINTLVDRGIDALGLSKIGEPSPVASRSTLTTDTNASCSGASGSAIATTACSSSSSKNGVAVSSSGCDRDSVYGGSTLRLCPDRRKTSDYMTASSASDFEKKRYNLTQQLLTLLCCIAVSLALPSSLGLAREARIRGLPFAVAYFLLLFVVGLPLSVVACTVGQFCGEAAAGKAHRAVPLVKGVVVIRALACWSGAACVCLHASLALLQFVLSLSGPTPYRHCTMLRMRHDAGYQAVGLSGDECIEKTFLAGPMDNPLWYGVLAAISVVTFGLVMLVSRSGPAIRRLLIVVSLPLLALMLATLGIGASLTNVEEEKRVQDHQPTLVLPMPTTTSIYSVAPIDAEEPKILEPADDWWSLLEASLWMSAVNQLLYATTLGFGALPALCGRALHKADAVKTAVTFILCLCLSGALSMACAFVLADSEISAASAGSKWGSPAEAYNLAQHASTVYAKALLGVAQGWYGLGSLVTMALFSFSLSCTLRRPASLLGIALGAALIVRLCVAVPAAAWPSLVGERSLVPTLAVVALCIESLALLLVYGRRRLWSDIEFSVGRPVSQVWHWTATISCVILIGLYAWYYSIPSTIKEVELDRTTSWITAAASFCVLLLGAGHEVARQVGYNLIEKFRSACRPSLEWGPGDPVVRHSWKLWGGAQGRGGAPGDGERDFTLRRKGTRDYTHSARRQASRKEAGPSGGKRYPVPVLSYDNFGADLGELLTAGGYTKSQSHHDHITDIDFVRKQPEDGLVSNNVGMIPRPKTDNYGATECYERTNSFSEENDFTRGPYVLPDVDHICWRKDGDHNLRTNL